VGGLPEAVGQGRLLVEDFTVSHEFVLKINQALDPLNYKKLSSLAKANVNLPEFNFDHQISQVMSLF
jgi:hypothetical protein